MAYDPRIYEDMRKKDINDLTEQLELMVTMQDFTHPELFAILRDLYVPPEVVHSLLRLATRLEIEGIHPKLKKVINRRITQKIKPLLCMYRSGLAREGDAIRDTKERAGRIKVIKKKGERLRDRFRGVKKDVGSEEED